jgi:hypothetical protein
MKKGKKETIDMIMVRRIFKKISLNFFKELIKSKATILILALSQIRASYGK